MCVFACERLRLQHSSYLIKLFWICLDAVRLYEEHKLQHSLWIIMKHNTLSLALTFGNNHSNFIIECTKICFYWTCLCALKSLSLYPMLTLYFTFTVCAGRNSFKLFSHWIKHGNPIVIYASKRGCVVISIPVFIVFGMWKLQMENWLLQCWGCLCTFWIRPLIDI